MWAIIIPTNNILAKDFKFKFDAIKFAKSNCSTWYKIVDQRLIYYKQIAHEKVDNTFNKYDWEYIGSPYKR
jgi:hypothetical protein